MAVKWTDDQRRVIETRGRNLLVSAAAGSGKTAVLVERIVEMVSDGEHPVDIDRLLVMTFTSAAAAEMRERIQAAIEKRRLEEPENARLELQSVLVPRAQIATIDSFCLGLIQEYYNQLDLDPAFRIGDEGELSLLRGDVMREMLEDWYASGSREFLRFVETYAVGKSDFGIEELIAQVWRFSQSHPWPDEWLAECQAELCGGTASGLESSRWMAFLMEDLRLQAEETAQQLREAAAVCGEEGGPLPYQDTVLQDAETFGRLAEAKTYGEWFDALQAASFGKLSAVRGKDVDPGKKARVSAVRDRAKKTVSKWKGSFESQPPGEVLGAMEGTREAVALLLRLAGEFSGRYQEAKRERNLVDFNDLEHFALQILWQEEAGEDGGPKGRKPSPAADELAERYEEILVDEYQDSNLVQEALITALSRERFGQPNVFMVGDVKQSIYRFRLARPELFLEKYRSYSDGPGLYQKIELRKNFRSRDTVLAAVNEIFYQIMTRALGGIRYTEETALYPGAEFAAGDPEQRERIGVPAELCVIPADAAVMEGLDEDAADYTARELEAKLAAEKIRELTDPEKGLLIWDKGKEAYRTAGLGDVVILLRSVAGWAETFVSVLMNEGIPAVAQTQTGYFDTVEVETVLSLLAVVDNPRQDIPMAAVLRSPAAGLSDEELAWMTAEFKRRPDHGGERGIYAAVKAWLADADEKEKRARDPLGLTQGTEGQMEFSWEDFQAEDKREPSAQERFPEITGKLRKFEGLLGQLRFLSTYLPIHELIWEAYRLSGYYDYVCAMPAGKTRKANLDMLAEKAAAYENTSYKGLFHFIRYIERLKKYETDFGEAPAGETGGSVRIMSIHKSKGLEFPVVILAGMGKRFNRQDAAGKVLIDPDLGIASDCLDLERRVKRTTLKKLALKRRMELETMGEELRILYVAMTRAKEKLILTAAEKGLEKKLEKWGIESLPAETGSLPEGTAEAAPLSGLPFTVLSGALSYLDWILMSLPAMARSGWLRFETVTAASLVGREVIRQIERRGRKEDLLGMDCSRTYDGETRERLEEELSYQYPYRADLSLYAMLSVSEIKRRRQAMEAAGEEAGAERLLGDGAGGAGNVPAEPEAAAGGARGASGASRGTAFHRALQLLPFPEILRAGDQDGIRKNVETEIGRLKDRGRLLREDAELLDFAVLAGFLDSPLGRRMARAQREGRLHREQQFMVGIPAWQMGAADSEELVLVQGIIDAWIEEEDGLVLIDYKTDRVRPGGERYLKEKYRIQLEYYGRSLEQITGRPVKETILYSLALQREIRL